MVAYLANHYKDLILVANGIINFLSYIEKRRTGTRKKEPKKAKSSVFVLVMGDHTLRFPSSSQSQRKFLSKLKDEDKERD